MRDLQYLFSLLGLIEKNTKKKMEKNTKKKIEKNTMFTKSSRKNLRRKKKVRLKPPLLNLIGIHDQTNTLAMHYYRHRPTININMHLPQSVCFLLFCLSMALAFALASFL